MLGTIMDYPLTFVHLLERAKALFPEVEIATRRPDKSPSSTAARARSPRR